MRWGGEDGRFIFSPCFVVFSKEKDSASVGVFPGKVVFCNTAAKMDDLQILVEWERAQLCDDSSAVHGDVREFEAFFGAHVHRLKHRLPQAAPPAVSAWTQRCLDFRPTWYKEIPPWAKP